MKKLTVIIFICSFLGNIIPVGHAQEYTPFQHEHGDFGQEYAPPPSSSTLRSQTDYSLFPCPICGNTRDVCTCGFSYDLNNGLTATSEFAPIDDDMWVFLAGCCLYVVFIFVYKRHRSKNLKTAKDEDNITNPVTKSVKNYEL